MCIPFDKKKTYFPHKKCTNASLEFNLTLLVHTNSNVPRNGWICYKSGHIRRNNCHTMHHPRLIHLLPGHLQKERSLNTGKARAHRLLGSRERRKSEKSVENVHVTWKILNFRLAFQQKLTTIVGSAAWKTVSQFFQFIHLVLRYLSLFLCLLSLGNY